MGIKFGNVLYMLSIKAVSIKQVDIYIPSTYLIYDELNDLVYFLL